MKLSYLPQLLDGKIPSGDIIYDMLNKPNRIKIDDFVSSIPERYDIQSITSDVKTLDEIKAQKLYLIIDDFINKGRIIAAIFFIVNWINCGFLWGAFSGVSLIFITNLLDKSIGSGFNISKDSINLINDYCHLVNSIYREEKNKEKK